MTLQEILRETLEHGIEVTMFLDKGKIKYNVNTGAKSHLHLHELSSGVVAEMRYDEFSYIEDFHDLAWQVKACMHGRDYVSAAWMKVFIEKGWYKTETKTETKYVRTT